MARRAVVAYLRISKDVEGERVGVDRQEQDCRALAGRLGLTIDHVYVDNDTGASTLSRKKRPEFAEMMELVDAGQVEVILSYSNSRLTRRPRELEWLIEAHARTGVKFKTVVSGDDDLSTADGRFGARVKSNMDTAESERIGERTRRAKDQARAEGLWLGGWRPYGYENDGRTPRAGEAAVIAETVRELLDGASLSALVTRLNDREIVTATGGTWSRRSLARVLQRPHPAISEDLTLAVRHLLTNPQRRTTPGPGRRWLLSGLAYCGVCLRPLRGSGSSLGTGRGTYPAYRCASGRHVVIGAVALDSYITTIVTERLYQDDVQEALAPSTADTSELRLEAAGLRARLDALADDLDLDERTLARRSRALRDRLDAVEASIATVIRSGALSEFAARDPEDVWAELPLDRRRTVVGLLMTITVHPGRRGRVPEADRWRADLPMFDPSRVQIRWN